MTVAGSIGANGWHEGRPDLAARSLDAGGVALLLLAGGVLAWWRRAPTVTMLVTFFAVTGYNLAGYPPGPAYLPAIVGTFAAILWGRRWVAYAALACGYLLAVRPLVGDSAAGTQFGLAAWLLVLAGAAEIVRIRTRARRAETDRRAQAARAEADAARSRASEQRLRVARELHDTLGHQLALITVQANAGLGIVTRDPSRTADALRAIKDAGNAALADLQFALDTLRASDEGTGYPGPDDDETRHPAPLLSSPVDLARLLDGAHAAGMCATLDAVGPRRVIPFAVDRAAYRIVQEAVTNAIRYTGAGANLSVRIAYEDSSLSVVVTNDGGGPRQPADAAAFAAGAPAARRSGGIGLVGMRERVSALGGRFDAGPDPRGGFTVQATLPIGPNS
ncbi:sensor histidine kinase [Dactylosporangium sp. McL0621]|uniref:sensor histidine kinase n=1 Tax=Dactylosporangium sp. McL0621 TaxID=3415678 RepID=UPI003CEFABEB